jgi:hypothetical protein
MEEPNQDVPTWAHLFERAATYGIDESSIGEALARRRAGGDTDE